MPLPAGVELEESGRRTYLRERSWGGVLVTVSRITTVDGEMVTCKEKGNTKATSLPRRTHST